jgi:hypothetical protein
MNLDDLTPKDGDFVREVERIQARMQALNVGQQLTDVSNSGRKPAPARAAGPGAAATVRPTGRTSGAATASLPHAGAANTGMRDSGADRALKAGEKPPLTRAEAEALITAMKSGEVDVRQWLKTPMGIAVLSGASLIGAGLFSLLFDLPYFLALAIIGGIAFSALNPKKK